MYGRKFSTPRQAMDELVDWMMFCNHRKMRSTLACVSSIQLEIRLTSGTVFEGLVVEQLRGPANRGNHTSNFNI
jgi:hypothetical protein